MAFSKEEKRSRKIDSFNERFKGQSYGSRFNASKVGVAVLFQKLVRLAQADDNGNCQCVSCGTVKKYTELQGGHFISRKNTNTILDERNCWPQCVNCNKWLNGNLGEYRKFLVAALGEQGLADLEATANEPTKKWTTLELAEIKFDLLAEIRCHEKRINGHTE